MAERSDNLREQAPMHRAVVAALAGMLIISGLQAREEIVDHAKEAWRGFNLLEDE